MTDAAGDQRGQLPLPRSYADPPIPEEVRSILVFGGSFDPPHIGHRELGLAARQASGCDWLLLIPAAQSPHKETRTMFSGEERLELLRRAFDGAPRVSISAMELERRKARPDEPSYTVDTLHTLRGFLPLGIELRLLIGADQAMSLHRWREPRAIMALAEPVVMHRAGSADSRRALAEQIVANWTDARAEAVAAADWQRRIVDIPMIKASSTRARELLALAPSEHTDAELRELLGDRVFSRVREWAAGH
jgi:nicotinate-nucleotide adenylyltransferase